MSWSIGMTKLLPTKSAGMILFSTKNLPSLMIISQFKKNPSKTFGRLESLALANAIREQAIFYFFCAG
jgi:hypothetical protein